MILKVAGRCNRQACAEFSATLGSVADWDSEYKYYYCKKTTAADFPGYGWEAGRGGSREPR
jgi:hypothetical protein